ncbi:GMC family oxidoreductase [Rhodoplanes sp. Z2-YC6860]|uniref:GMC family oxidoreductase n=1 Tax=Rhodoplanes sp. Z2-YC6860 TaxID=674703 RepID=UPI00078ED401|nr:GMC family oxidoreductase [Rhodoplanes sp. Z2-YC6860]AMN39474.1 gluconate 2-dehydrogenase [Rhodoplanes sp. Z2-YC6860]
MATKLKDVDVVVVGLGWTGGILSKELTEAGLKVVALERGNPFNPANDFALPNLRDELRYVVRHELMQNTARDTLTIRNNISQEALPMRRLGSFLPGEGVGGSATHWSGHTWRWTDMEFKVRSMYEERYGKSFIPDDMTIQDWGITYNELEPYYDRFEYTAAVSGKAGNIKGQIVAGGNPFEAPRARDYALPPLTPINSSVLFTEAAKNLGYHPFPRPSANASQPYTNPDGSQYGACQYCGYCQRFGCEANAKGSPLVSVIPIAMRNPNFELRAHSWVTKVIKDSDGKKVTGVAYTNVLTGEEFEQPANIVLLCAYAINNVHLMLLSGTGQPYDPAAQTGVVGKNYCYQNGVSATLFFEGKYFNPFISAGGSNATIDDFNINWAFDRGPHNFIGGYNVAGGFNTALPIGFRPVPRGTPQWGTAWKAATKKWYQHGMTINAAGSVMANRNNYFDLDPTYRNAFGQPLMRMTFDYKDNEKKMGKHSADLVNSIAKSMNPTHVNQASSRDSWTVVPYQSTHNTGGTIMGTNPKNSVVNKYLQSWDCHNLFTVGANVFPHNSSYNPTGPVGALAYWTADAIKNRYLKSPGPLVQA